VAKDTRQGLNCTLTYARSGTTYGFRLRCTGVAYGFSMVAEESQARTRRAYYPHRLAPDPFAIRVQLKGYPEKKVMNDWLASYAVWILDPSLASNAVVAMTVTVPSRNFSRRGILVRGVEYGDHVGSMLFEKALTFVTIQDPSDPDAYTPSRYVFDVNKDVSADVQYFYPSSTQLSGDDTPPAGAYLVPQQTTITPTGG
jgi:hypothetical protein